MKFLLPAAAGMLLATNAFAAEMRIPASDPVATITVPDDWKPTATETGLEANAPDDSVYLEVDACDIDDVKENVDEMVKYLTGEGVKFDEKTGKRTDGTVAGLPFVGLSWSGTDKDGPAKIDLAAINLNPDHALVVTVWGTAGEREKHKGTFREIMQSVRQLK